VPTTPRAMPREARRQDGAQASNTSGHRAERSPLPANQCLRGGDGFVSRWKASKLPGAWGLGLRESELPRQALELSIKYCAERRHFEQRVAGFPAVQSAGRHGHTHRSGAALAQSGRRPQRCGRDITAVTPAWRSCSHPKRDVGPDAGQFQLFGGYGSARLPRRKLRPGCKGYRESMKAPGNPRVVIARSRSRSTRRERRRRVRSAQTRSRAGVARYEPSSGSSRHHRHPRYRTLGPALAYAFWHYCERSDAADRLPAAGAR